MTEHRMSMFDIWANNNNHQTQTVPPTSSLASTSTVHQHEFNYDTLQQRLKGLIYTARESWTYAIFWQSSVSLEYSILGWGDGYYKGEQNKPKTVMSATSIAEQQHRKKVVRELNSLISGTQSPENDTVDEEVTDSEWFFLISMTQSFVNGFGLPGQAMVTNQPVWVAGGDRLMTSHCERARQGQGFGLQTIVCIPSADGVIELGSTELIYQSSDIMKKVRGSFNFNHQGAHNINIPPPSFIDRGQGISYVHNGNLSNEVAGVSGQPPSISDMARGNMSSGCTHSYSRDHSAPSWNALYIRDSSPMMTDSDSVHQIVGSEFGRNDFSEVSSKA